MTIMDDNISGTTSKDDMSHFRSSFFSYQNLAGFKEDWIVFSVSSNNLFSGGAGAEAGRAILRKSAEIQFRRFSRSGNWQVR